MLRNEVSTLLELAVCDQRTALDYFRLSADRRLLFGGLCNYTGLVQENYVRIMRRKMLAIFPQLDATGIEFAWDGQMAIGMRVAARLYVDM